ncbi:hypothetical protein ACS2JQ_26570 [Bacillus cereus group sp. BceL101]|uniref:hypothetical protein n=2 Tax=Bacillus TaxID=1386 RepID=UPI0022E58C62|nr:hypothetical protein [Bacillus cereus]MDF9630520.1 hypothetical protein [Bacillus cereus]MDF9635141.1 hypothetical protein [Bacillus cereus]MDG1583605.1 hypothetical protein [Bacillus cereus]MDZ4503329.1 hypothetical protein [Bacillus cereus]WKT33006.1 hypothetical protein QPK55_09400 [Bacillus cereus]
MNKIGTKGILDDIEKETTLRQLIVEYDENHNSKSKITYKDIYEFVKLQYNNNKVDFYPGYTWWKTKGKHLVDEYNLVKKRTISLSETEDLDVFDILDVVEKHYGDKEALIKYLLPYTDLLDRLVNKINKLQNNSKSLSEQIGKKDERIQVLEQTNSNQQALLDGLFYTIIGSEKELDKVMERGSTKSDTVNYALSETFGNPATYIEEFSKRIEIGNLMINDKEDNVVKFKTQNDSLEEDDYDY